jgi:hypothetical protein
VASLLCACSCQHAAGYVPKLATSSPTSASNNKTHLLLGLVQRYNYTYVTHST